MEFPDIDRQHESLRQHMARLKEILSDPAARQASDLVAEAASLYADLKEHFTEEEEGGYLDVVLERRPGWRRRVERLREQHRTILEKLGPLCESSQSEVADGLGGVLTILSKHDTDESTLMMDAFNRDVGSGD